MSQPTREQQLLAQYLRQYLWPDREWLEMNDQTAVYWQARLAQTTTVALLPDGRAKWRVRTVIVNDVAKPEDALQLCIALNAWAAGWSFAYNSEQRTVDALIAVCAPPEFDTFLLRLSEKAKSSAWMSDVIAERLADAVGGTPAFSHPEGQPRVRERFDGTYHYVETVRGRPEAVLDLTRHVYPATQEIAEGLSQMVGLPADAIETHGDEFRMPVDVLERGEQVWLFGGFEQHPIVGASWRSAIALTEKFSTATAAEISAMTWSLFDAPQTSLLGGWTYRSGSLAFTQWNTMSEVRNQEQLASYDGRGIGDLWGFTSTLNDAMHALGSAALAGDPPTDYDAVAEERAAHVIDAIFEQARPAVQLSLRQGDTEPDQADRRLLWLDRDQIVAVAVWFNPMGPTVATIETCRLPDGSRYLAYFRRHPFAPLYRVVGLVKRGPELQEAQRAATDLLISGTLPNVLAQWNAPDVTADEVPQMLRQRVLEISAETNRDLIAEATWIEATIGRPWEFVAHDQTVKQRIQAAVQGVSAADADTAFNAWWEQVSSVGNVVGNFLHLPDAWDGALNSQQGFGNLHLFDVGPLLVTYSDIGTPHAGRARHSPQ